MNPERRTSDGTKNMKWVQSTVEQNGNTVTLVTVGLRSQSAYGAEFHVRTLS